MSIFLSADEIATLTGKRRKSCQVAWLRESGIPFHVNACGRPVVTRAAVEGRKTDSDKNTGVWHSAVRKIIVQRHGQKASQEPQFAPANAGTD
ncbi:MAG: DUF4224 domain-containing protein [Gammaproteobacteria bacterium]